MSELILFIVGILNVDRRLLVGMRENNSPRKLQMYTADSTVQVNIRLSKEIYDRAAQTAADEQCRFEDLLSVLVSEGLETHTTVRWLFEQVSILYRTRLECEGKLSQTPNEVLQELRIQREQIARELYPG